MYFNILKMHLKSQRSRKKITSRYNNSSILCVKFNLIVWSVSQIIFELLFIFIFPNFVCNEAILCVFIKRLFINRSFNPIKRGFHSKKRAKVRLKFHEIYYRKKHFICRIHFFIRPYQYKLWSK